MEANRVQDMDNPPVVFQPVDPCTDAATGFRERHNRVEGAARIGGMVQHPHAEDVIETTLPQWQRKQIPLDDQNIGEGAGILKGDFHRVA